MTGLLNNLQRTGTTTGSPPSPFLQSLALDVRVITDEDLVIENNVADAQLGADLRVINVAHPHLRSPVAPSLGKEGSSFSDGALTSIRAGRSTSRTR